MSTLCIACFALLVSCVGSSGSVSSSNATQVSRSSVKKEASLNKNDINQGDVIYKSLQFDPSLLTLYTGCPTSNSNICAAGQVKIEGVTPDGDIQDITGSDDIYLSVDDPSISQISRSGTVYPNSVGTTVFHAKSASLGLSADLKVTVKQALQSIVLIGTGSSGSVTLNTKQWLAVSAKGVYVDESHANITKLVNWNIADTNVIKYTMGPNYIEVDPLSVGHTTLTASLNGVAESVQVNVTN